MPTQLAAVVGLIATIGPLAVRRRFPLAVLAACVTGFVLSRILLDSLEASIVAIALSLAFYSAAAHGSARWRNRACATGLVVVMAELAREVFAQAPEDVPNLLSVQILALLVNLALFSAMWALGNAVGSGRRRASELYERTVALEHERARPRGLSSQVVGSPPVPRSIRPSCERLSALAITRDAKRLPPDHSAPLRMGEANREVTSAATSAVRMDARVKRSPVEAITGRTR